MFESVVSGATDPEIEGVDVVRRPALSATAADVLGADGIVREARVETDYRQRAEPDELIGWARRHAAGAAR